MLRENFGEEYDFSMLLIFDDEGMEKTKDELAEM
jgi:hypothetical protein